MDRPGKNIASTGSRIKPSIRNRSIGFEVSSKFRSLEGVRPGEQPRMEFACKPIQNSIASMLVARTLIAA